MLLPRHALASVLLAAASAAGCVHTRFTRTTGLVVPARAPGCHLDMTFRGPPPRPYVVLGQVATDSTTRSLLVIDENEVAAVRRLMEQACAVGAHGLMDVATDSQHVWTGKGYWNTTIGAAVAFVYVDASGRPLPPPPDPRAVIVRP